MSRDHTEIIYALNLRCWIDEQMVEIERQRSEWPSEAVQAALYWKNVLLAELSELLDELEVTVNKDSIVKVEHRKY